MEYLRTLVNGRKDFLSIAELEKATNIWKTEYCLNAEEIEVLLSRFKTQLRPLSPEGEEALMDLVRIKFMEDLVDHALGLGRFNDDLHYDIEMMLSRMKLLGDASPLEQDAVAHAQAFMSVIRKACFDLRIAAKVYALWITQRKRQ